MNYVELDIPVTDEALAEILMAELAELPFESFTTERTMLKAFIVQDALADCKDEADRMLQQYGITGARYVQIESQNWNALWESNFSKVRIGDRAVIRAPFHEPETDEGIMEIVITPRMAFGTGHHSTTAMMVEALLDSGCQGLRVLDMGSGTGVLSIAALKCGAAYVDAVDIDDAACNSCLENLSANFSATPESKPKYGILSGDVRCVAGRHYDLIAANINRNILLRDMEAYGSMLGEGGRLFVSGFLEQDIAAIVEGARNAGFEPAGERIRDGWGAMEFLKKFN